jgi:hypothetical protein
MPGSAYYIMDLHRDLYVPNNPVCVIINVCEPVEALNRKMKEEYEKKKRRLRQTI